MLCLRYHRIPQQDTFHADLKVFSVSSKRFYNTKLTGALGLERVAGLTFLSFRDKTFPRNFLAQLESWKVKLGVNVPPLVLHSPTLTLVLTHTLCMRGKNVLITFLCRRPYIFNAHLFFSFIRMSYISLNLWAWGLTGTSPLDKVSVDSPWSFDFTKDTEPLCAAWYPTESVSATEVFLPSNFWLFLIRSFILWLLCLYAT